MAVDVAPPAEAAERVTSVFDRYGLLYASLDQHDPVAHAARNHAVGVRWIALKFQHANEPVLQEHIGVWRDAHRARGIRVGGWMVNGEDPKREARVTAEQVARHDLELFIADAEDPHKDDAGGDARRSDAYVETLHDLLPRQLPRALTTYGAGGKRTPTEYWLLGHVARDDAGPMHFRCWYDAGYEFLPQAYPNQYGAVYEPANCVAHADQAGWPRAKVHLMVGLYGDTSVWNGARYATALRASGTRGCSVFLGETAADADLQALRVALAEQEANQPASTAAMAAATREEIVRRCDAMIAEWSRQGIPLERINNQRIAAIRTLALMPDAAWPQVRPQVKALLGIVP